MDRAGVGRADAPDGHRDQRGERRDRRYEACRLERKQAKRLLIPPQHALREAKREQMAGGDEADRPSPRGAHGARHRIGAARGRRIVAVAARGERVARDAAGHRRRGQIGRDDEEKRVRHWPIAALCRRYARSANASCSVNPRFDRGKHPRDRIVVSPLS